jgi:hypothetical protein
MTAMQVNIPTIPPVRTVLLPSPEATGRVAKAERVEPAPARLLLCRARTRPCASRKMSQSIQAGLLSRVLMFMVSCGDQEEVSDRLRQQPSNDAKRIIIVLQSEG